MQLKSEFSKIKESIALHPKENYYDSTQSYNKIDKKNVSMQTRSIKQIHPIKTDSGKYHIFFTLDDGPQLPGTQICKNILRKNKVKATFFMVGTHVYGKERQNLIDSIQADSLFIIGNHSDTHAFRNKFKNFYQSPNVSVTDFITAENKLCIKNKIARLPGRNTWAINKKVKGESSAYTVAEKLDSIGYSVFGWDVEWRFKNGNIPIETTNEMIKKIQTQLKNNKTNMPGNIVILVHDRMFSKPQYTDSLTKFITILKENNQYTFETIDKYPLYTFQEKIN